MATQTKPIHGKIAKILNSRQVALNVGAEQGVKPGMRFAILDSRENEILDPDTGTLLGSVNTPKVQVKVSDVWGYVSLASTYRTKRVDISRRALFQRPQWERRYETLKSGGGFAKDTIDLDPADSYVAIGDLVVQVIDDPA